MNTIYKYRPRSIDEYVFANKEVEQQVRRYTDGKTTLPLVLHGKHGTGKSLLAELIPKAIDGENVSVNKINAEDLNNKKEVRTKFSRAVNFDRLFSVNGQRLASLRLLCCQTDFIFNRAIRIDYITNTQCRNLANSHSTPHACQLHCSVALCVACASNVFDEPWICNTEG